MKKILKFIGIIIATILLADIIWGVATDYYVKNHSIPGDYETIDYLIKDSHDDIIIMGSSVALNSAISTIIEDSLGMSVWNGACNGQQMPYFETLLDCHFKHHKPRAVIFGLRETELSDCSKGSRYNMLAPYYGMGFDVLDSYIEEGSWVDRVMAQSNLYRYNTIWVRILLYNFIQPGEKGEKGFIAKGIPAYPPTMIYEEDARGISEQGVAKFLDIVKMCRDNGVEVAVFFPPMYKEYPHHRCKAVDATKKLCLENDIFVYDAFQDSMFLQSPHLFYDNIHLNKEGAKIFSYRLAHELKHIL